MRFQRLRCYCIALIQMIACAAFAAEPSSVVSPPLLIGGLRPVDAAFDIRFELYWAENKNEKAFQFIEREFQRDPRAHVKARYAEFLLTGKEWGAPEGQGERGWTLANDALREGSVHAWRVVGWNMFRGEFAPPNPGLGLELLVAAGDMGNGNAMISLGNVYLQGRSNVPVDPVKAESWFVRAAYQGKTHGLFRLGQYYELNAEPPSVAKAAMAYYEAATRGSTSSRDRLKELAATKDPAAVRAQRLHVLWFAAFGSFSLQTATVREAVQTLEKGYPEDPLVLLALGRVYASGFFGFRDFKKAHALLEGAMARGSEDARAERAMLYAEGIGVKKDGALAVAEFRALADKGNPLALAYLGYYHYWGLFDRGLLPKDAEKAFEYSRRAADAGDPHGQANAGACFEFGIGTKVDYALAAYYYRSAAWRGLKRAQEKMRKLPAFVTN